MTVGRFPQQLQTLLAEALKAVRGGARLECATADDATARLGYQLGRTANLLAALNAARSGHDDDPCAAKLDVAGFDHRAGRPKGAAGQLVWRGDAVRFLYAVQNFKDGGIDIFAPRADTAQHRVNRAGRTMHIEPRLDHAVDH